MSSSPAHKETVLQDLTLQINQTHSSKVLETGQTGMALFSGVRQITGEVVAPKTIKNSRNYAAGALNLKDVESSSLVT